MRAANRALAKQEKNMKKRRARLMQAWTSSIRIQLLLFRTRLPGNSAVTTCCSWCTKPEQEARWRMDGRAFTHGAFAGGGGAAVVAAGGGDGAENLLCEKITGMWLSMRVSLSEVVELRW